MPLPYGLQIPSHRTYGTSPLLNRSLAINCQATIIQVPPGRLGHRPTITYHDPASLGGRRPILTRQRPSTLVEIIPGQNRSHIMRGGRKIDTVFKGLCAERLFTSL